MHILLIEDLLASAKAVELKLAAEGHTVSCTDNGEEGVEMATLYDYDVILLDLDLPDMTGVEVIRELRLQKVRTPIIVLTGTMEVETKVKTLSLGADDYLTKPFHKGELIARIHAVVRRAHGHSQSIIRSGDLELNLDTRKASVHGQEIHLTPSEYKVLELLSLRKNSVLTKEMCLNHLYNGLSEPEIKIIDVFVCKLRKKLAAVGQGERIETVWGNGYMLRDPEIQRERVAA